MGILNNSKIRTKLTMFIVVSALMLVATGGVGIIGITVTKNALLSVYNEHLLGINQLNEMRNRQMQIRIQLLTSRQETDLFEITDGMDRVRSHIFSIENLITEYKERVRHDEQKKLLDEFVAARINFGMTGVMPMIDLLQKADFRQADTLRKQALEPAYEKASQGIDALIQHQVEQAKNEYDRASLLTNSIYVLSIGAVVAGLVLSVVIGLLIARSVSRGVSALERATARLAKGDLAARAECNSRDELGEVAGAFNRMAGDFASLIGELRQSADQVAGAAATLSTTSDRVSEVSKAQVAGAGSAANSIEDLNAAVKEIAQRADGAVTAADEANAMSDHGQRVVAGAVQGIQQVASTVSETAGLMAALGQRSNQIGQIIQVIRGIAEQTNLLALNAAIEAARAGEQGRGFAVVADEVRNLAERTSGATAEISDMIKAIQTETGSAVAAMETGSRQAEGGVEQANQAMLALQQINGSVKRVVEMIQGIAAATRSQSQATDSITVRVEEISEMAKDNSNHIDQTTQASHDLHKLSAHFQQLVSRFQV
ncbi:MAG TPA: methyl-accepting chemotaxis protein [Acidiferrobacterales bacterium]|nr:methyl-accepting chemotaxis protein [Acidiferrobacterales bacterium]